MRKLLEELSVTRAKPGREGLTGRLACSPIRAWILHGRAKFKPCLLRSSRFQPRCWYALRLTGGEVRAL